MQVSVIMAVKDGGRFLDAAIKSVRAQTLCDFEFIIIDDGSTDNSREVIAAAARRDQRIRPVYGAHEGITRVLNRGLGLARAPYIARMDADDISLPHRLEKEYAYLEAHPEITLVSCYARVIDDVGRVIGNHAPPHDHDAILRHSFFAGQLCHPAVMFRRDAVMALHGYDEAFRYAQDYDLWFRLMQNHRVANIPEVLFSWRASSSGIGRAKQAEQRKFATRARVAAIRRGLYPRAYYLLLFIPYIEEYVPQSVKDFFKRFL